jgi:tetrahydromethanopterin S-methyltransferase subunit G
VRKPIIKKQQKNRHDIFISYRIAGGADTARIIREHFTGKGYKVFLDVESLQAGSFDEKLLKVIEGSTDFVVVLSKGSLERCKNSDDWVRREIEHALSLDKNIIPVKLDDFLFPDDMPDSIAPIKTINWVEANHKFFKSYINKLESFLTSKPALPNRITRSPIFKRILAFLLSAALLLGGAAAYNLFKEPTYPKTQEEKNLAREVVGYVTNNFALLDSVAYQYSGALKAYGAYANSGNELDRLHAVSQIEQAQTLIKKLDMSAGLLPESVEQRLYDSPFDLSVTANLYDTVRVFAAAGILENLPALIENETIDIINHRNLHSAYQEMSEALLKFAVYQANAILLPLDGDLDLLKDFKTSLGLLTNLPVQDYRWRTDEAELENDCSAALNKYEAALNELSMLVGGWNILSLGEKKDLLSLYMAMGLTEEQAREMAELAASGHLAEGEEERLINKQLDINTAKNEMDELQKQLEEQKSELREKFAPKDGDDPDLLWGKALKFLSAYMTEEAIHCFQAYQARERTNYANADIYTPVAIQFVRHMASTGVNYGLIIGGFMPEGAKNYESYADFRHESLEIGDIIVAVDGAICRNYNDFGSLRDKSKNHTLTVMRYNFAENSFEYHDIGIEANSTTIFVLMELANND